MKTLTNIIYWGLIAIALIQFVPVERTNKPVKKSENFVNIYNTPQNIQEILKNACYDCHSNETVYPDYAYVAPISWAIKNHINEGREHLNFSEWGTFNRDLKKNMLENSIADLQQNRMPIPGYMVKHPEANLTSAQRKLLVDYLSGIINSGDY